MSYNQNYVLLTWSWATLAFCFINITHNYQISLVPLKYIIDKLDKSLLYDMTWFLNGFFCLKYVDPLVNLPKPGWSTYPTLTSITKSRFAHKLCIVAPLSCCANVSETLIYVFNKLDLFFQWTLTQMNINDHYA